MEARSKQVGSPPLRYMFPDNGGLKAGDASALMAALPDVVPRILPDLHVGAGGAVQEAAGLFANPPVPGFNQGAINCETNAGTHDLTRGLNEAADLIEWMSTEPALASRLYGRTASFCSGSSNGFDSWDQGISFFLPNMTWLQPPGHVHAMFTATWGGVTLSSTGHDASFPFVAQLLGDGGSSTKTLVLRVVNTKEGEAPMSVSLVGGGAAAGPTLTRWTLGGKGFLGSEDNTPSQVDKVAPVSTTMPISSGATFFNTTIEPLQVAVFVIELQ